MAATNTIEDEVVLLESAYWEAMKLNDTEGSLTMTHDPCIVTGAQGVMKVDHNGMRKMSQQKTWKLKDYTIDNMNVLVVSDSVVVTGYTIKLSMEVEGKATSMNCSEGSTWVKQNGRWVCPLHCESPMGDPFGRDKSGGDGAKSK